MLHNKKPDEMSGFYQFIQTIGLHALWQIVVERRVVGRATHTTHAGEFGFPVAGFQSVKTHTRARIRRMNKHTVTDINTHMRIAKASGIEKHHVARTHFRGRNALTHLRLLRRRTWQIYTD